MKGSNRLLWVPFAHLNEEKERGRGRRSHLFKPKGVLSYFGIVCRRWSPVNVSVTKYYVCT